jgi:hypothetical protein
MEHDVCHQRSSFARELPAGGEPGRVDALTLPPACNSAARTYVKERRTTAACGPFHSRDRRHSTGGPVVFFKLLLPPGAQGTRARRRGEAFVGEECAPPPERVNSRSRDEAGRRRDVIARPGPARPGPARPASRLDMLQRSCDTDPAAGQAHLRCVTGGAAPEQWARRQVGPRPIGIDRPIDERGPACQDRPVSPAKPR